MMQRSMDFSAADTGFEMMASRARVVPDRMFAGPHRPIAVAGADQLGDELMTVMPDWPWAPLSCDNAGMTPDLVVERAGGGIRLTGSLLPEKTMTFGSAFEAADTLSGALVLYAMDQDSDYFQIHASAAVVGDGVVAFLGDSLAGKSSLAIHLAAQGQKIFGDDRLMLRASDVKAAVGHITCYGLGLAPKLRLPLPQDAGAAYADFVEARRSHTLGDVFHLALKPGEIASYSDTAPLKALVVLDRGEDAPLALTPGHQAATVQALLSRSMAPRLASDTLLQRTALLAKHLPCYGLSYSASRAAAALIIQDLAK